MFYFQGSPVYYSPEEPSLIHSDRSPYSFEPAASGLERRPVSGIMTASNEDFVIQEHTYKMCPECPTFSIPIPKVSASEKKHDTADTSHGQKESEESIFDKVRAMISTARSSVTDAVSRILQPQTTRRVTIEKRISTSAPPPPVSPLAIAGLAVLGLGVARLLSASGGEVSGRGYGAEDEETELVMATNGLHSLENLDYNTLDPACVPRNYCETMKRKKYLIDHFPLAKRIGLGVAEMVWDRDHVSERGESALCNLRECVFSLLR